jgi:hypothetical protein
MYLDENNKALTVLPKSDLDTVNITVDYYDTSADVFAISDSIEFEKDGA